MTATSHSCTTLTAAEDPFARASVYSFAVGEYLEAKSAFEEIRERRYRGDDRRHGVDHRPLKPLADFSVFLAQSRTTRIRRERDATCYNDTTRHAPGRRRTDL